MRLTRKHGWILAAIAVWNVLTYARFTKALVDDDSGRPTGYFVAHGILIVVNVLVAALLGSWAWRVLRPGRLSR